MHRKSVVRYHKMNDIALMRLVACLIWLGCGSRDEPLVAPLPLLSSKPNPSAEAGGTEPGEKGGSPSIGAPTNGVAQSPTGGQAGGAGHSIAEGSSAGRGGGQGGSPDTDPCAPDFTQPEGDQQVLSCCNGVACRGTCLDGQCSCFSIEGGCFSGSVCCYRGVPGCVVQRFCQL